MEKQILKLIEKNPMISSKDLSVKLNTSKSTILRYLKRLNINRGRKELQKYNNGKRGYKLNISTEAEQIILGSILGDGYVSKINTNKNSKLNLNSRLVINHSIKQQDYAQYKTDLLNKYGVKTANRFKNKPNRILIIDNHIVHENENIRIETERNVSLNIYRKLFYKNTKYINRYIYKLSALGLAIWFQDDGSKNNSGYYLHTQGFTLKDIKLLQKMLLNNFNIKSSIHKSRNHFNIYINKESVCIFNSLVLPYICESMKYKIHLTS